MLQTGLEPAFSCSQSKRPSIDPHSVTDGAHDRCCPGLIPLDRRVRSLDCYMRLNLEGQVGIEPTVVAV